MDCGRALDGGGLDKHMLVWSRGAHVDEGGPAQSSGLFHTFGSVMSHDWVLIPVPSPLWRLELYPNPVPLPPPACMQVAGSPELYPILVDMGCVPTLLACLSHENTDIAADTLELFMELSGAGVKGGGAKGTGGVERGEIHTGRGYKQLRRLRWLGG